MTSFSTLSAYLPTSLITNTQVNQWLQYPTLLWFFSDPPDRPPNEFIDTGMETLILSGIVLSILAIFGITSSVIFLGLWLIYLSMFLVGHPFLGFQWDTLLLEVVFLSIWWSPLIPQPLAFTSNEKPSSLIRLLLAWLLFRLLFGSAEVKLNSSWSDLRAMDYHYVTTCLPNPLSWYFYHLPSWVHSGEVWITFFLEGIVPFAIFASRKYRIPAAFLMIGLQSMIAATGNYGFFNMLSGLLSIPLLDDLFFVQILPEKYSQKLRGHLTRAPPKQQGLFRGIVFLKTIVIIIIFILILSLSIVAFSRHLRHNDVPVPLKNLHHQFSNFHLVSSYGLFSHMTKQRIEIDLQGKRANSSEWESYVFRYKPGAVNRPPPFVSPHMPRLDWQMWFAGLSDISHNAWFLRFSCKLLQSRNYQSNGVTSLLDPSSPFFA